MNITITGNLGSGKSSVAKILQEKGYEIFSTGKVFRQLAMEKGLSVEEFNKQVNEAAAQGDRSVDKMIDDMTTKIDEEKDNVVFDSRLAWHFAPKSFKVFVITDIDEASRRVFHDSQRVNSESYATQADCKKALIHRQKLETVRYQEVYQIDYYDMSNYNLVIESTNAAPAEIAQEILDKMKAYQLGKFQKLMELNPSSVHITENAKDVNAKDVNAKYVIEENDYITVNEKGGEWILTMGRSKLENAIKSGAKFISVKVAESQFGGEDSFMNFSKMK